MTQSFRHLLSVFTLFSLLMGALISCGTEIDTPGERLRIFEQTLDPAFIGEPYSDNVEVLGGLAPYTYEVSRGTLPPGLELQGATLRGAPTEAGSFTFTVSVSDANLSETFEEYALEVTVPPPATLDLSVPETEMSEGFTVPVSVNDARDLRAFRTLLTWDAERFELAPGSVRATRGRTAFFQDAEAGELSVDVAFLGEAFSGSGRIFTFDLIPLEPSTIEVSARTEFRGADNAFAFAEVTRGTAPGSDDDLFDDAGDDVTGGAGDLDFTDPDEDPDEDPDTEGDDD